MEVKCPKCASRFHLSDGMAKVGIKLRCSVCQNVFVLESLPSSRNDDKLSMGKTKTPEKKSKKMLFALLFLLVTVLLAGGLGWYFFLRGSENELSGSELAEKVKFLTMRNVRQYIVENEKVGKVFVIEGSVVNEFPTPKELIAVEAAIYGRDKRVIQTKQQRCGTQLSLFQLQVLSEKEMEAFLNNKIEILTNNINVKHGAEVPFMVLFYAPPDDVSEFGVKIVDVRDAPKD